MDLWTHVLNHNWTPNGDATFMGGVTIFFYVLTSLLCFYVASRPRKQASFRPTSISPSISSIVHKFDRFWLKMGLAFFVLALHKHFNWLVGITNFIRNRAYDGAWYSSRRTLQGQFIVAAIILMGLLLLWRFWRMRQSWREKWLPTAGLIYLVTFVVTRSISLHSMDALIFRRVWGLRFNWILEWGGIGVVAVAALWSLVMAQSFAEGREEEKM